METLVLSETHYLQEVLQECLGMTREHRHGHVRFAVKQHDWMKQAKMMRRCFPIQRVVTLRNTGEELPPDFYCVDNANDLSEALNIPMSPAARNKINERVFKIQSAQNEIRILELISFGEPASVAEKPYLKRFREPEEGDDCAICMAHKATILFVPCSHQTTCDECAKRILEASDKCPMCRQPVSDAFRPIKN